MSTADDRKIAEAVALHAGRLRAFVRRQISDAGEVDEIVQEVFYELTRALRFMQPVEHLAAWLWQIARNRIIDRFRARRRSGTAGDAPDPELAAHEAAADTDVEADYDRERLIDALQAALAELPAEQREVFIAHELEGLSFKELAAATGLGVNTLLGRKHAAVVHLRRRLQSHYDELEL